jgi:hypothetical protein
LPENHHEPEQLPVGSLDAKNDLCVTFDDCKLNKSLKVANKALHAKKLFRPHFTPQEPPSN